MLDKIDSREQVESRHPLSDLNSNMGHCVPVLLESFITSIWCGANRFLHPEVTIADHALAKIFNWKHVPGQDAYKRYFNKFDQKANVEVNRHFFS